MNKQIIRSTITTIALIAGINIATPAQAFYNFHDAYDEESDNIFLPESITNSVLQNTSELSGLGTEELEVVDYERFIWTDGCMGFRFPGVCTLAIVPGWVVTVESETQKWIYHASDYGIERLASHYQWEFDTEQNKFSNYVTNYSGIAPLNFFVPKTQEYNQGKVEGFRYTMTSDFSFDRIILPTPNTEENLFTILTENSTTQVTSTLVSNSQSIDLNSSTSEAVKEFTIADINSSIDWSQDPAFITFDLYSEFYPLWLEDNDDWLEDTDLAFTYTVELLAKSEEFPGKPIPEPSITFSLLALGILGLLKRQ
ncbi:hypothetical protein [Okeania sp. KiyG1]|uniref:hypothetical protein n=1 Tax=Okeania sp. KiyG1 TaxID=2720165 RepID=UPI0019243D18|nr:hypothetical protein [Okeania sp. KiyG1]GGA08275.1 hypothetical protein CYANOKiyG1_20890 [Okeania sp. KiyG1]